MNIDSIKNGIVLDHIRAGRGMQIYNSLGLDQLDCSVAIIKNVKSSKMGKKRISIKISDAFESELDVLGYIDPEVTVCVIENGSVKSNTSRTSREDREILQNARIQDVLHL